MPIDTAPAIDIDAVSGRELDALVAEHVMKYGQVAGKFSDWIAPSGMRYVNAELPEFSSINRVWFREVEVEIERRGLPTKYIRMLMKELGLGDLFGETVDSIYLFELVHATPAQRCRAALKAVMNE